MDIRRQSSPARLAAILALIAALLALVIVISASVGGGSNDESGKGRQVGGRGEAGKAKRADVYRVKAHDTLCGIAEKFATDCAALQQLNPKIDPLRLHAGQTVKLR
jgi:LysM repeat protein